MATPATAAPPTPTPTGSAAVDANPRPYDRTSALEARRVDRVPAPKFVWRKCIDPGSNVPARARCATIRVPLDYDTPNGPTTTLGIVRLPAVKRAQRIGSLFLNPGGPSGSATDMALFSSGLLDRRLLDRFDIVGVDPRGVNRSEQLRCFGSTAAQLKVLSGLNIGTPLTAAQTRAKLAAAKALGKACGTTGGRLASHMSTAQVARDMDVVRRALGDKKLTYLGFSYCSQLGQMYANMFPDRVRALVLDGVVDPVAWTTGRGDSGSRTGFLDRIRASDAAYRALHELMDRCDSVGTRSCAFAGTGDSMAKFDRLARRLKQRPAATAGKSVTYDQLTDELGRRCTTPGSTPAS